MLNPNPALIPNHMTNKEYACDSNPDRNTTQQDHVIIKEEDQSDCSNHPPQWGPSESDVDLNQHSSNEQAVPSTSSPKRIFVVRGPTKHFSDMIFNVSTEDKPLSSWSGFARRTDQSVPSASGSEHTRQSSEHIISKASTEHQPLPSCAAFTTGSNTQSVPKATNQDIRRSSIPEQTESLKKNVFIVKEPTNQRAEHIIFKVSTDHEPITSWYGFEFYNRSESQAKPSTGPILSKQKSGPLIRSRMNQVTNPIKQEEIPKPINFETKNLTREQIELLMLHTHNFMKWEKAKKEKDPVGFKRTTIKAKELHRKLTSKIGISRVLEETHGWNPLEWDWITFEKKQRELVKGHQRELLRTLEQTPRLSKAELKAILHVVIRTLDD